MLKPAACANPLGGELGRERYDFSFGLGYKINNSRIDLSFEKFSLTDTHQMLDAGFLGNINLDKEKSVIKLSVVTVL